MALNDTKIQRLQGKERSYQLADGGGLYLEVQPTGKKVWRMSRTNIEPRNIRRVLDKDVLPAIGEEPVAGVTIPDILAITDAVKARGADQMALQTRNVIKRLFAYAIARGKTRFNPAAPPSRRASSPPPEVGT